MKRLLILGSGGLGKEVLECAIDKYESITFMTNNKDEQPFLGYKLIYEQETSEDSILNNYDEISIAIGNNRIRMDKINHYLERGMKLATIIHPKVIISRYSKIDTGCIISENVIIGPMAHLGIGCRIGPNGIVCHECNLANGVNLSPKVVMGGGCTIGENSWLCIGSTLSDHIHVGKNSVVGAGAVVLKDVPDNALMVGVPAFIKKYYEV